MHQYGWSNTIVKIFVNVDGQSNQFVFAIFFWLWLKKITIFQFSFNNQYM